MSNDIAASEGQRTQFADPCDPLRREFIAECCGHVARVADTAFHAISIGNDELFEANIAVMRLVMREAVRTFNELKKGAKQ